MGHLETAPSPRRRPRRHRVPALVVLVALATVGAGSAAAATPAAAYCTAQGGTVSWTALPNGTPAGLCTFHRASDDTRISIGLRTLASPTPTVAVLAYLERPRILPVSGGANPASVYCAQLHGSEPIEGICRFADGSMIDSWGLRYHTQGTVRGRDLTSRFRYRGTQPAPSIA
jgi:putative hemolysin